MNFPSLRLFHRLQPWTVFFLFVVFARAGYAQQGYANWGAGAYSAMPRCNYELRAGKDVIKHQDTLDRKKRELQGIVSKANGLKRRLDANKGIERSNRDGFRDTIRQNGVEGEDFNVLEFHVNSGRRALCSDYSGYNEETSSFNFIPADEEPEALRLPADQQSTRRRTGRNVRTAFRGAFFSSCEDGGRISHEICNQVLRGARGSDPDRCERYLDKWQKAVEDRRAMQDELRDLEDAIRELEMQANLTNSELEAARRQAEEDIRKLQTEGGCISCLLSRQAQPLQPERPLWLDIAGVAAQAFLGYTQANSYNKIAQAQIDADAKIGFRSNGALPMNAFGYGGGILANGLVGVLASGTGQGGYGCSGGLFGSGFPMGAAGLAGPYGAMNVNGAFGIGNPMQNALFGFPQGMYGTPPGMGMFNPGIGMNFQAGLGSQAYCPRWPCPVGPGMYGGGVGGPFGFRPGFGGSPFGGMPGYGPGAVGFQGGFGAGFNPFGGSPFGQMPAGGAMFGGPFGGYRPGYPMAGGAGFGGMPFGGAGGFGAVGIGGPFGGYRPGMPGYGPGAIGFQGGAGFGNPYGGFGGAPGAFGIPYGGNPYGNPMMAGAPMGMNLYGGGFGNPMAVQAYAAQAQQQAQAAAMQAQYAAQQAAMQAQAAQQQQYAYQQWLNNYQAGVQQLNMLGGQMSALQQQIYMTQASLQSSVPPTVGGAYGGYGGMPGASAYLGIDFNLYRGYSPYGGAGYSPFPGFAPGPPPPPGAPAGGIQNQYTR